MRTSSRQDATTEFAHARVARHQFGPSKPDSRQAWFDMYRHGPHGSVVHLLNIK
jgi:hypothetical protein